MAEKKKNRIAYMRSVAMKELYQYLKWNSENGLPEYWNNKGAKVCIDGIISMIVRDKYTDQEIADFYECHVSVIELVKIVYEKTIKKLKKEHEEMVELFGDSYTETKFCETDQEGVLSLLEIILEGAAVYEN